MRIVTTTKGTNSVELNIREDFLSLDTLQAAVRDYYNIDPEDQVSLFFLKPLEEITAVNLNKIKENTYKKIVVVL